MAKNTVAITGAMDPEMQAIIGLLEQAGIPVIPATKDGRPVHAGNAYAADPVTVPAGATVLRIECEPAAITATALEPDMPDCWQGHCPTCGHDGHAGTACTICPAVQVVVIDHHRPGDPGYGRPPEEFMAASSIGQVIAWLTQHRMLPESFERMGGDVPREYALCAAADHCLAAAYAGRCPGVDPDALMKWRARSRAAFQRRPVEDVLADVEAARRALAAAPDLCLLSVGDMPHTWDHDWSRSVCDGCAQDEQFCKDMRGQHIPELPEASARDGVCFVADGLPDRDGRVKVVCQSGTSEQIRAFMDQWAPARLRDIYGDPARGFAGGYQ